MSEHGHVDVVHENRSELRNDGRHGKQRHKENLFAALETVCTTEPIHEGFGARQCARKKRRHRKKEGFAENSKTLRD